MSVVSALVLLGHGSRAPGASQAMERIAQVLRTRRQERIEVAHMELAQPSLTDVLDRLHGDGIRHVVLVPYFLHHGVHLREDIPGILDEVRARLPDLEIAMAPHLGYDDALVDVVERRVSQAAPRMETR
ncbi:MAG: CbiX/SirB N-terminal domain-containing protein [Fibrobacteres bacterium]|nr:CbiX/SirB N-terminal domain-containing protein [Fibrobacterota bacterium]